MRKLQVLLLAALLVTVSSALVYYKVTQLGLPLLPGQQEPVWSIEAAIEFEGLATATVVNFDLPDDLGAYVLLDEFFVSRKYGLNVEDDQSDRRAEWSTRRASGRQRLYYRAEIAPKAIDASSSPESNSVPVPPQKPDYPEPLQPAVQQLLSDVRAESANVFTFASQLLVELNDPAPDGNVMLVRGNIERGTAAWVERIIYVLAGARISARMVRGIVLEDRVANQILTPWLEIHNGKRWEGFNPLTGNKGYPDNFVRWAVGNAPLVEVDNGRNARVSFAVSSYATALTKIATDRAEASASWLSPLLTFNLPISTQNLYRILLMVPVGALAIAFMRTIVGVPTLGTFMPILIAIAFRETEIVWGIALFVVITTSGLMMRFYLERLQLLLVPRLCAVLVLVVLLMLAISLLSARLDLDRGFSIALFPMVILTMVIEHMSVVWEESGAGTAIKEAIGSLFVAVLGYLIMTEEHLTHVVFLFPETLLALLAVFIMLGRYTGYRVTELMRFKDIVKDGTADARPHP